MASKSVSIGGKNTPLRAQFVTYRAAIEITSYADVPDGFTLMVPENNLALPLALYGEEGIGLELPSKMRTLIPLDPVGSINPIPIGNGIRFDNGGFRHPRPRRPLTTNGALLARQCAPCLSTYDHRQNGELGRCRILRHHEPWCSGTRETIGSVATSTNAATM